MAPSLLCQIQTDHWKLWNRASLNFKLTLKLHIYQSWILFEILIWNMKRYFHLIFLKSIVTFHWFVITVDMCTSLTDPLMEPNLALNVYTLKINSWIFQKLFILYIRYIVLYKSFTKLLYPLFLEILNIIWKSAVGCIRIKYVYELEKSFRRQIVQYNKVFLDGCIYQESLWLFITFCNSCCELYLRDWQSILKC